MKVKEYIQWLPLSRKRRVLAIIIIGVAIGGGALTLYMPRAHTYLTDDPAVCANCHIMGPYYATWFHSSHNRDTTCNDYHVSHEDAVKKWVFRGMDGVRHVVVFLTHGEKDVVRANGESSEVVMNNCICCHTQLNTEFVSIGWINYMMSQVSEGKVCWGYHQDIPYGGSNSVAFTPNALVPYLDSPTPEWLKRMIE